MRALLVQSRSPTTYWSFEHIVSFLGKAATYPTGRTARSRRCAAPSRTTSAFLRALGRAKEASADVASRLEVVAASRTGATATASR